MHLTKPQEIIWDMEQFSGDCVALICTSLLRHGYKDEESLRDAVDRLFCINDALRIRIRIQGGTVTQYISEHQKQQTEVLYFSDVSALTEYADSYRKTPINLCGALCEIKILILPEQYGLLLKIHHLIADAWAIALLAIGITTAKSNSNTAKKIITSRI